MTPMPNKPDAELPKRIMLYVYVDGNFNPTIRIQEEEELRAYFGDPMHVTAKPPVAFVPESENQTLRATVKAQETKIASLETRMEVLRLQILGVNET